MHAETFTYMLHNLPAERKIAPPAACRLQPPAQRSPRSMLELPAGSATLGKRRGNGFGWDNEFDEHTVELPAFAMDRYKVTNGDYLEFVKAGADPPYFWVRRGNDWFQRTMFGLVPLPLTWPVYATRQQAAAYAKWRKKELPTEAQFHRAADGSPDGAAGNCDFRGWDPVPVTALFFR